MDDILSRFSINCHSSIRYAGAMTVWFDPFRVADAPCDADVVFVTHDHYDHFSPEDIRRVMKPGAVLVLPETCVAAALRAGFASAQLLPVRPGEAYTVKDLPFTAVPAYNLGKPFHPRGNRWVGYVVTLEGRRVYVAGDTDDTPDARSVSCDVAFLPVGGTSPRRESAEAAIQRATAALEMARLNLSYTVVVAPCDGKLGRRALEEGQFITAGQTITYILPDTQKWIVANYKETQVENLHIGQEVTITVDAISDKEFTGTITAISGATGSKYSLVPTDNSAGNFVKIQQRIPVRIDFTNLSKEDNEKLAAGMMVIVKAEL